MTSPSSEGAPRISVVVFSFNFERFLDECLDSVLGQTLSLFEVVVCDDHSSDASWEVISRFSRRYPDVVVAHRHPENIGHVKNGVFGKDQARGELVTVIDGDDRWQPRKLEAEWEALRANPKACIAYSNVREIDETGAAKRSWFDGKGEPPPSGDILIRVFAKRLFTATRSVYRNQLMYTDTMRAAGYGDENITVHVDWDLKIRLAAQHPVAYSGETTVDYRIHGGGIHHTRALALYESALSVVEKNLALLHGRATSDCQYVLDNVNELLRELAKRQGLSPRQFTHADIDHAAATP